MTTAQIGAALLLIPSATALGLTCLRFVRWHAIWGWRNDPLHEKAFRLSLLIAVSDTLIGVSLGCVLSMLWFWWCA